jgi:hypothetical protein
MKRFNEWLKEKNENMSSAAVPPTNQASPANQAEAAKIDAQIRQLWKQLHGYNLPGGGGDTLDSGERDYFHNQISELERKFEKITGKRWGT